MAEHRLLNTLGTLLVLSALAAVLACTVRSGLLWILAGLLLMSAGTAFLAALSIRRRHESLISDSLTTDLQACVRGGGFLDGHQARQVIARRIQA